MPGWWYRWWCRGGGDGGAAGDRGGADGCACDEKGLVGVLELKVLKRTAVGLVIVLIMVQNSGGGEARQSWRCDGIC